jgi:hypothetical protein
MVMERPRIVVAQHVVQVDVEPAITGDNGLACQSMQKVAI